jgi:hypothetical protein
MSSGPGARPGQGAGAHRDLRLDSRQPSSTEVLMRLIGLAVVLAHSLFVAPLVAEAQQTTKVTPIGYLSGPALSANAARIEAFRQGLRELSYVEGSNIVIEARYAEGRLDRLHELAAELMRNG